MRLVDAEHEAYWRGVQMAESDRLVPGAWPRVSPLSGEWAGESALELLGDLVDAVAGGLFVESDWDECEVIDVLSNAFKHGYALRFPDMVARTYSVCPYCYYVLHNGINESVSESVDHDETRVRPAGSFGWDVHYVADAHDYGRHVDASFLWRACECCGSTLGGDRYDVNVWDREPEGINVGELAW